ncbi:MAG: SPASM domain-containing protein [Lachnospiraceae bacterium]|nr:SPASM domain-containing protein [Lachnospiraceae bacterium]MBD5526470.1 SPASM domain-containing protein [Lachnospiraceae bacterium]
MKIRKEKSFISLFDPKTGRYIRTGIMKNGKDTGIDPFMASFPELLDVGIMGHCRHGQSGLCIKAGIECYQDGLHQRKPNMSLHDFENIALQCSQQTYQFALGGCGDPDQHEHFREILEICTHVGIVPNYTTSGFGITEEQARLCKKHCGAVAVSWYRSEYTRRAVDLLVKAGVKTNIHYVLNKSTVHEAVERLKAHEFPKGINAIVFLLHKPVGLGKKENIIAADHEEFQRLLQLAVSGKTAYKIGFDSCTVPALINISGNIAENSLDTCEGARWSAYISPDMKMMPCSFDNQEMRWAVDLREYTIKEAWNSAKFEEFRDHFRTACHDCENQRLCMGGCPIRPEIVICKKKVASIY